MHENQSYILHSKLYRSQPIFHDTLDFTILVVQVRTTASAGNFSDKLSTPTQPTKLVGAGGKMVWVLITWYGNS